MINFLLWGQLESSNPLTLFKILPHYEVFTNYISAIIAQMVSRNLLKLPKKKTMKYSVIPCKY